MVVLVSHDDASLAVTRDPGRPVELPGPGAQGAELVVEGPAGLEYLEKGTGSNDVVEHAKWLQRNSGTEVQVTTYYLNEETWNFKTIGLVLNEIHIYKNIFYR